MRRIAQLIAIAGLFLMPLLLFSQGVKATPDRASQKIKIISSTGDSVVPGEIDISTPRTQKVKVFSKRGGSTVMGELDLVIQPHEAKDKQSKGEPPEDYVPYDQAPEAINQVPPHYPQLAQKAGLEGTVWVKVWVDEGGKVVQTSVQKTDAEIFNQSATEAAMQWKFKPAMMKGKPIATWVSIPFRFKISGNPLETRSQESVNKTTIADRSSMGWQESVLILLIVLLFALVQITLALVALMDIVKSRFAEPNDKLVWTIIAALLPIIGPILYFVSGRKQKISPA
jgi:TonB family protein